MGAFAVTVTFVILRCTHVVNWQWVWVLSPWWIGATLKDLLDAIEKFAAKRTKS